MNAFIIVVAFLVLSLLSSYLSWGPLTSREMVEYFGPKIKLDGGLTDDQIFERKRKAGFSIEMLRVIVITVLAVVIIPSYSSSLDSSKVVSGSFFLWSLGIVIISAFVYNFYIGPRLFALKHCRTFRFSEEHFRKYMRPYWAWFFYGLLVFGVVRLLLVVVVAESIISDIARLQSYTVQVDPASISDIKQVQMAVVYLNNLGDFISSVSQKYMLTSVLIFLYALVEQRSFMVNTVLDTSVEWLKYIVWIGLILTISFSFFILPYQYLEAQVDIRKGLEALQVDGGNSAEILSVQRTLRDYDLKWLMLQIVAGYGNLSTTSIFLDWHIYLAPLFQESLC